MGLSDIGSALASKLFHRRREQLVSQGPNESNVSEDYEFTILCLKLISSAVIPKAKFPNERLLSDIFPADGLLFDIYRYLGHEDAMNREFVAREPELQDPECRRAIAAVIERINEFAKTHPEQASFLRLPKRTT
jgi:hypothetical protein